MLHRSIAHLPRRRALHVLAGSGLALALAACGETASEPDAETTVSDSPEPEPLTDNLASELPALPEMRSGRSDQLQERTDGGRFDRVVYFSEVTPGHVLNFYLDEMPALQWTEVSRSELTARGGELVYDSPGGNARLVITVERRPRDQSSTVLDLTTTTDGG